MDPEGNVCFAALFPSSRFQTFVRKLAKCKNLIEMGQVGTRLGLVHAHVCLEYLGMCKQLHYAPRGGKGKRGDFNRV